MPIVGDWTQYVGLGGQLPVMAKSYQKPFSITRYNQLRTLIAAGLDQVLGAGVIVGGALTDQGGLTVRLASGTILWVGGIAWLVDANLDFDALADGAPVTNTIWATIARADGDYDLRNSSDAYSLVLQATTVDNPPNATYRWVRLGYAVVNSGDITSLDDNPPGKYLGGALAWRPRWTVGAEASNAIQVSFQLNTAGGSAISEVALARVWLADVAGQGEAAVAPDGGVAINTGDILEVVTGDLHYQLLTSATGLLQLTITESTVKTFHVHVAIGGRLYVKAVAFA